MLIPYKLSQNGPFVSTGDLNGDHLDDIFIGSAAGYPGAVYLQSSGSTFTKTNQPALAADKAAEDMESSMFDADGDQDMDILVVSGSNEFQDGHPLLKPRLYLNDGHGQLTKAPKGLVPEAAINALSIEVLDTDGDQDQDIFIGGRMIGGEYAVPASSVLWINQKGKWVDETKSQASFLQKAGMVTDAVAADVDKDGDQDLLVVGEWMSPTLMVNDGKESLRRRPSMQPAQACGGLLNKEILTETAIPISSSATWDGTINSVALRKRNSKCIPVTLTKAVITM